MKAAYYTLGCKVNQYDTQLMRDKLEDAGYQTVTFEEEADVYVINTCTVTQISDKKSRQMIRRARKNNPAALVAVCGCYAQTHAEEAKSLEPDLLMGTNDRTQFLTLLEKAAAEKTAIVQMDDALRRTEEAIAMSLSEVRETRAKFRALTESQENRAAETEAEG